MVGRNISFAVCVFVHCFREAGLKCCPTFLHSQIKIFMQNANTCSQVIDHLLYIYRI